MKYRTPSDLLDKYACVHYFLQFSTYAFAAVSPLIGIDNTEPSPHPEYGVTLTCKWPPPESPSMYIDVRHLLHKCILVHIKNDTMMGSGVAHIATYIHKVRPNPSSWRNAYDV